MELRELQIELYNSKLNHKIEYNQIQFSIVHSHMISEGLFVNMSEIEACNRSGAMIEYSMIKNIKLQAWSPLMASWEDGCFIDHPKYQKLNDKLNELALKYNVSKNAIAISWILRHPAKICPVVGTTSIKHLDEMIKAMCVGNFPFARNCSIFMLDFHYFTNFLVAKLLRFGCHIVNHLLDFF